MFNTEKHTQWSNETRNELDSILRTALQFNGKVTWWTFAQASRGSQQALCDKLFSSRDTDSTSNYWGNCYCEIDSRYFGITLKIKPEDYLNLALTRNSGTYDFDLAKEDLERHILGNLNKNQTSRIGVPFLKIEIDEKTSTLTIKGHEGRHRANAIMSLIPEAYIPVDLQFLGEIRRRNIKHEILDYKIVNQDGKMIKNTLRDMLPVELKNQFMLGTKDENLSLINNVEETVSIFAKESRPSVIMSSLR